MSVIVSPSLLAADFMNLGKDVEMVDRSTSRLDSSRHHGRRIRAQYILWFTCCISNQENSP